MGVNVCFAHSGNRLLLDPTVQVKLGTQVLLVIPDIRKLPKIGSPANDLCQDVVRAVTEVALSSTAAPVEVAPVIPRKSFLPQPTMVDSVETANENIEPSAVEKKGVSLTLQVVGPSSASSKLIFDDDF